MILLNTTLIYNVHANIKKNSYKNTDSSENSNVLIWLKFCEFFFVFDQKEIFSSLFLPYKSTYI